MNIYIHNYTLTSALGAGVQATRASLRHNQPGLTNDAWPNSDIPCYLGKVSIPDSLNIPAEYLSRNNQLIEIALHQDDFFQAVQTKLNEIDPIRCGLVMGTSTSSIDSTEAAYRELESDNRFSSKFRHPELHNPHAPGIYVAEKLGIKGPQITISAACASSAKVFATAKRWLQQDLVDAVIVGGADSLCLSVIYGFHSLQLVSEQPCRPFDQNRQGISLGEAAGFALLSKEPNDTGIILAGAGESCDAFHMSSAHPEGLGAKLSIQGALDDANFSITDIDYINLHGTGTLGNDKTEGAVCDELLNSSTIASATKGWTGHTLGAAGIVEAVLSIESLITGFIPGTKNTNSPNASFNLLLENEQHNISTVLSNSFGFGGNNCSLIFSKS